jgi:hypothetical protein
MMLEPLSEYSQNFLCHHITLNNVCELLDLAHTFNATLLKEECIDVILRNYLDVLKLPQWKEIGSELRAEIDFCLGYKKKRTSVTTLPKRK